MTAYLLTLFQLPCFYFFLLGLFMWLNFSQIGGESVYIFYPVILFAVSLTILMLPLPILYFRSRQWLLYSLVSGCMALCVCRC